MGLVPSPVESPPTSLEGAAQPRLAVPLVVTDGPIAALGGCFGAVTPDTQLVSTALTVPGAELRANKGMPAHILPLSPALKMPHVGSPHAPIIQKRQLRSEPCGAFRGSQGGRDGSRAGDTGGVRTLERWHRGEPCIWSISYTA